MSIAAQVETERLNEHSSHLHVILAEERQKTQHLEEALTQAQRRLHQQDHTTASEVTYIATILQAGLYDFVMCFFVSLILSELYM